MGEGLVRPRGELCTRDQKLCRGCPHRIKDPQIRTAGTKGGGIFFVDGEATPSIIGMGSLCLGDNLILLLRKGPAACLRAGRLLEEAWDLLQMMHHRGSSGQLVLFCDRHKDLLVLLQSIGQRIFVLRRVGDPMLEQIADEQQGVLQDVIVRGLGNRQV